VKNAKKVIIWDIDGTISDTTWRLPLIKQKPKNWPKFMADSINDNPIAPTEYIYKSLANEPDNVMIVMTARSENEREITEKWLDKNLFVHAEMFMRKAGDSRPDWQAKLELIDQIEAKYGPIFMAFEDRPNVLTNVYHARKIFVLDVGQGVEAGQELADAKAEIAALKAELAKV